MTRKPNTKQFAEPGDGQRREGFAAHKGEVHEI